MKCRICKSKAVVNLRYANTAFCKKHFIEFFERRVEKTIRKFNMIRKNEKIAAAVSGGKDSLTLLYVLNKLSKTINFELIGVTIDLGIGNYSKYSVKIAEKNYRHLGVYYVIVDIEDYGFTIDEVLKYKVTSRICSICGAVKRYILNRVAKEEGVDKIATGHNLDDFLQVVLQGYLYGNLENLSRFYPVTPSMPGLVGRIKPLVMTPEKDVLTYTLLNNIEFADMKCPYSQSVTSHDLKKAILYVEDRHPGTRFMMFNTYIKKLYPLIRDSYFKGDVILKKCDICGEPTNAEICLFCRVKSKIESFRQTSSQSC